MPNASGDPVARTLFWEWRAHRHFWTAGLALALLLAMFDAATEPEPLKTALMDSGALLFAAGLLFLVVLGLMRRRFEEAESGLEEAEHAAWKSALQKWKLRAVSVQALGAALCFLGWRCF